MSLMGYVEPLVAQCSICSFKKPEGGGTTPMSNTHKQVHFKKGGKDRDNRRTRQLGLFYSVLPPHLTSPVFTPHSENVFIACTHLKREEVYWRSCEEKCTRVLS